jgi:ABC-type multidrug transport system ATPase subunit
MRIELSRVVKRFGRVLALDDVSLALPAGARVALIGPNGSGKTTLTRVIMGVLDFEGDVRLDGRDAFAERAAVAARLAYVPQIAPQVAASVGELVRATAALRGLPVARTAESAAALELDLAAVAGRPFRGLSGGMKQKVLLAMAFAARASLYILDEPTASLDAGARERFYRLYAERAGTATLLLCSHRLEEIRHLVDHVVALADGKVAYHGPAAEYLAGRAGAVVELEIAPGPGGAEWAQAHGFSPGAGHWWLRTVSAGEKVRVVQQATQALGARLTNLCVRDLEAVAASGGAGAPATAPATNKEAERAA